MPVVQHRSAGVIVFRRDAKTHEPLYLLLDYGKHWDFPKGHVEKGEDERAAALRELNEETGISKVKLNADFHHTIQYFYRDPKQNLVRKTVEFLLAETAAKKVRLSHEHVGYEFLPYEKAMERLTFPTARKVLEKAQQAGKAHGRGAL